MIHEFIFPLPPTLNKQIDLARDHWSKSSSVKKEWTNKICAMALADIGYMQQKAYRELDEEYTNKVEESVNKIIQKPVFPGAFWMQWTWYVTFQNDADNVAAAAKFINDGLVNAGIIKDDSLKYVQSPVVHNYEKISKATDSKCRLVITDYNPWKANVKTLQSTMWK